jgi:hypothetical protein
VVEVDTTAKAEDAAPTEEAVVAGEEELFPQ